MSSHAGDRVELLGADYINEQLAKSTGRPRGAKATIDENIAATESLGEATDRLRDARDTIAETYACGQHIMEVLIEHREKIVSAQRRIPQMQADLTAGNHALRTMHANGKANKYVTYAIIAVGAFVVIAMIVLRAVG